jgi:glutamate dehydrogenase/leucine dehydrogenase
VGYHTARFCRANGAKIIAIAEYNGGIYSPDGINDISSLYHNIINIGINPEHALLHFQTHGSLKGLEGTKFYQNGAEVTIKTNIIRY